MIINMSVVEEDDWLIWLTWIAVCIFEMICFEWIRYEYDEQVKRVSDGYMYRVVIYVHVVVDYYYYCIVLSTLGLSWLSSQAAIAGYFLTNFVTDSMNMHDCISRNYFGIIVTMNAVKWCVPEPCAAAGDCSVGSQDVPDEHTCSRYFTCTLGNWVSATCPEGQIFDPNLGGGCLRATPSNLDLCADNPCLQPTCYDGETWL
jgi:hypothetical protein